MLRIVWTEAERKNEEVSLSKEEETVECEEGFNGTTAVTRSSSGYIQVEWTGVANGTAVESRKGQGELQGLWPR